MSPTVLCDVVDGRSVPAESGATVDVVDPSTGGVHATAPHSGASDVDAAFTAAARAFESWRWTTPAERQMAVLAEAEVRREPLGPVGEVAPWNHPMMMAVAPAPAAGTTVVLEPSDTTPASSVWTSDVGTSARMAARLDLGCVWVDTHVPPVGEMPHGGFKHSGHGEDLPTHGPEDHTRIEHVMVHHGFEG